MMRMMNIVNMIMVPTYANDADFKEFKDKINDLREYEVSCTV